MQNFLQTTRRIMNTVLVNFTLAKFAGAFVTIIIVASIKYLVSGNFHIEYSEFGNNVALGLIGWTLNTTIIGLFSEYLGIKGINFNLKEFLYGFDTMGAGDSYSSKDFKAKLYNAMESADGSDPSKQIDKGKGIDRGSNDGNNESGTKSFDPTSIFSKRINPGPGFNVPGGEVPLRDDICKHIDYNSHILKQFKTMDLQTALEQRHNYGILMQVLDQKTAYAQHVLSQQPEIPTNEHQYKLRRKILEDLEELRVKRIKAEGKAILINSRVEFIQLNIKPEDQ
jgi:hypothetical protein